jgi:hypothetical protein
MVPHHTQDEEKRKDEGDMFTIALVATILGGLFVVADIIARLMRGPWTCSCGAQFDDPDEALSHATHSKHIVE